MSTQLFSNFFESTLSTSILLSDTSIVLADGSGMQSPGTNEHELLVITDGTNWEIVSCTARVGNSCTVVRAQEGTTAYGFAGGSKIYGAMTAATYNNILTEAFVVAASDETTDLATGTSKLTFRMPYDFTVTSIRASVTTAPTGSTIEIDVNNTGVSILSTVISIDATEKTSATAATPPVITSPNLVDDDEITVDIDQVGSTIPGNGLKIYLIGQKG